MTKKYLVGPDSDVADAEGFLFVNAPTEMHVTSSIQSVDTSGTATVAQAPSGTPAAATFITPQISISQAQPASASMTAVMEAMTTGALSTIDSQLAALQLSRSSMVAAAAPLTSMVQQFEGAISPDGQYVVIDASATDGSGAALLGELQSLGLVGGASFGAIASGWLPISQIEALSGLAHLQFARESAMLSNTGSVTTQADHALVSDSARTTFGVNGAGAGVGIGVISDSFNALGGYSADVANGNLPAGVQVLQDSGTTDEGRAMAQLIYDIAPGASLSFATANGG